MTGVRAFFAVAPSAASKSAGGTFVVDLPVGKHSLLGPSSALVIDTVRVGSLAWDGVAVTLTATHAESVFVAGKRLDGAMEILPGDDIGVRGHHLVLGIAAPFSSPQRRSYTHRELQDRIAEELARAARAWRPTALAMVRVPNGEGGRVLEAALSGLRAGDCVATFAPDEVEFLLPDTGREQAEFVIGRTVRDAGAGSYEWGVAVAPENGDRPARLMRAARLALRLQRGLPAPISTALIVRDASMEAAVSAIASGLQRGSVVVRGESGVGRGTLVRAAHERAFRTRKQPLHAVVCSSLDVARVASLPKEGTILLEGADQLAPEVRDMVVLALSSAPKGTLRVAATTDRNLDARYGALGLWLSAGSATYVEVPPLRQRLDELVPLAMELGRAWTGRVPQLSTAALARLRSHAWPGNVSELEVAMERAMLLAGDGEIQAEHLPGDALRAASEGRLREHVDSVERDAIARALAETNHNQTNAAKKLGLSRRALIYKMEKYGMKPPPDSVKSVRQKR